MRQRPDTVRSITVRQPGPKDGENIYITLGLDNNNILLETFITRGKAGSSEAADSEWVARIISMALQVIDVEQVQPFLAALIKTSRGIQGAGVRFIGDGEKVLSAADAVAKVFANYYQNFYGQSYMDPIKQKEDKQ